MNLPIQENFERLKQFDQTPSVLWFTGLSGAGKTNSAVHLEKALLELGYKTIILDGDTVRKGLCSDLGFSEEDRVENVRRVAEAAKPMLDAGLIVIVALISPFRRDRELARGLLGKGRKRKFMEIYVSTPLSVCEERDAKGLYQKARDGQLSNFTGLDSPYEPPKNPDVDVDTSRLNKVEVVNQLLLALRSRGLIK